MGIINATPDSFYATSTATQVATAVNRAKEMVAAGAIIIDIGGQSTKPNATPIGENEEMERVLPIVTAIHAALPETILSIDTYYASVALEATKLGASIVNDVSAGNIDGAMLSTVAKLQTPYICMHMQGTPATMQSQTAHQDVVNDVLQFFISKIALCKELGIKDVIVDVGFGFGKTIEQNYTLLQHLKTFTMLDKPILTGISRKSMIYKALQCTPEKALNGTSALHMAALLNGASILRVHDVKEAAEVVTLYNLLTANK